MKKCLLSMFLLLVSFSTFSVELKSTIDHLDEGKGNEPHLIMLTNGRVIFLRGKNKKLIHDFKRSLSQNETLLIQTNEQHEPVTVQITAPLQDEEENSSYEESGILSLSYEPSIISYESATNIFRRMRRDYQKQSQCYNRAHIWTYEEYNRTYLRSNKLFLFFTAKYIRNYNFYWWFHVTPMVYVNGSGPSSWRTLDRRYTSGPLTLKTWTNIFMYNNATCPIVYRYSDYRYHQYSQDCYLIPTSMYFWQPRDIEYRDNTGYFKTRYFSGEISHAYWEAF